MVLICVVIRLVTTDKKDDSPSVGTSVEELVIILAFGGLNRSTFCWTLNIIISMQIINLNVLSSPNLDITLGTKARSLNLWRCYYLPS